MNETQAKTVAGDTAKQKNIIPSHPVETTNVSSGQKVKLEEKMSLAPSPLPPVLPTLPLVPTHANAANVAAARAVALGSPLPVLESVNSSNKVLPPVANSVESGNIMNGGMKSKKTKPNKHTVTSVSMATAPSALPANSSAIGQSENTGRWTAEEHRLFLQGLEQHGKGWKKIASLIKSRTVVQIRTHAQKYFQKLAKARQNGEDGDVSMEGKGGMGIGGGSGMNGGMGTNGRGGPNSGKRRRPPAVGSKRKAISGVVSSAQREGKRLASLSSANNGAEKDSNNPSTSGAPPLPVLNPALSPYYIHPFQRSNQGKFSQVPDHNGKGEVESNSGSIPSITTAHGTISGAALEDSLFRFLTPCSGDMQSIQPISDLNTVNDVARQAGASPIVVPTDPSKYPQDIGDASPTGVDGLPIILGPTPWYDGGKDVDELLVEADALDWLADTGDLNETYQPTSIPINHMIHQNKIEPSLQTLCDPSQVPNASLLRAPTPAEVTMPSSPLPPNLPILQLQNNAPTNFREGSSPIPGLQNSNSANKSDGNMIMPSLPSLFGSTNSIIQNHPNSSSILNLSSSKKRESGLNLSSASLFASATEAANATTCSQSSLAAFDAHFDEQAFVNALLENQESSVDLTTLQ